MEICCEILRVAIISTSTAWETLGTTFGGKGLTLGYQMSNRRRGFCLTHCHVPSASSFTNIGRSRGLALPMYLARRCLS